MAASSPLSQEEIIEVSRFYALTDLLKELSADVPGVTAFVRRKVIGGRTAMFAAGNGSDSGSEHDEELCSDLESLLIGGGDPKSPRTSAPAATKTPPPHSRILEKPPADNSFFSAQVQEAERKAMAPNNTANNQLNAKPAEKPAPNSTSAGSFEAPQRPPAQNNNKPLPTNNKPAPAAPAAQGAAYGVPARHGGAGAVVVHAQDPLDFPSLGDTSIVGRATNGAASGNRSAGGSENKAPQGHMKKAAAAPAFVPVHHPQQQPRHYDENSFTNGMVFKANNKTYGECLQRQLFGLPANQMTRSLTNIAVNSTALFLFNFQTNELEGVFVATVAPCLNLEPDAWSQSSRPRNGGPPQTSGGSPFPAQVRVRKVINLLPVYLDAWEHLVHWHTNNSTFDLTLDQDTTRELIMCLRR